MHLKIYSHKKIFTLICNNIFQYYHFHCTFNQIDAVLLSIRIIKTDLRLLNSTVSVYCRTTIWPLHHCKATAPRLYHESQLSCCRTNTKKVQMHVKIRKEMDTIGKDNRCVGGQTKIDRTFHHVNASYVKCKHLFWSCWLLIKQKKQDM